MAISVTKPTVGGSEDTWGATVNTGLDTIVDALNGTSGTVAPNLSTLTVGGVNVTATATELSYSAGVTSAIQTQIDTKQTQIDTKAPLASPTLTGTATVATVSFGDWTIVQSGTDLVFSHSGTARLKLSSAGALTAEGDVTAFGDA